MFILSLVTLSTVIASDSGGWVDRAWNPVPNSDEMKSVGGFGGWLVVTWDSEWEAESNTPSDHAPNFSTVDEVKVGEVLAILPLFINPKLDAKYYAKIHCDIRIVRPDISISMDENNLNCFTYKLPGDPRSIWLSSLIPKFVGEATDPKGNTG